MLNMTPFLLSVTIGLVLPDGEITGTLRVDNGPAEAWSAMPTIHTDYALPGAHDQRPWAASDNPGCGYEIDLPAVLDQAGFVHRLRVARAVEECIYLTRDGKLLGAYHRSVDPTVPVRNPNLPRLVPAAGNDR
jgi:hypothetical protein